MRVREAPLALNPSWPPHVSLRACAVFIVGGILSIAAGYLAPHDHTAAQVLVLLSRLIFGVGVGGCSAAVPMCEWCIAGRGMCTQETQP